MMRSTRCISALLLLLALATGAAAQTLTPGPAILVHDKAADNLDLAVGASGGLLVSWEENEAVRQRAYSPTEQPAEASAARHSPLPTAATGLSSGLYVIVWTRSVNAAPGPLLAQFLDSAGRPAGEAFELDPQGSFGQAVVAQPDGGFVVAWRKGISIVARRFDGAGAPVGQEVAVTSYGEATSLASLPNGGFVVAWTLRGAEGRRVRLRVFGPDGAPVTGDLSPDISEAYQDTPRLAASADGRFLLAWTGGAGNRAVVRYQRFSARGEALSPALVATEEPGGKSDSLLDMASRPDGSFLVLFERLDPPRDFVEDKASLLVKALDASGAALGNVLQVTDVLVQPLSSADAEATAEGWTVSWSMAGQTPDFQPVEGVFLRSFSVGCGGTASALCLGGSRFRIEVAWKTADGAGAGSPIPLTDDTGAFWFFSPSNYELNVKILDGRGINGRFWVFYGSLTDVEFDLTVTDTATGQVRTYHNPAGNMASRADTSAF